MTVFENTQTEENPVMKKMVSLTTLLVTLIVTAAPEQVQAMNDLLPVFMFLGSAQEEVNVDIATDNMLRIHTNYSDLKDIKDMVAADKKSSKLDIFKLLEAHGYLELVKIALENGAKADDLNLKSEELGTITPAHLAAALGRTTYLQHLYSKGCKLNTPSLNAGGELMTPTDIALLLNQPRAASYLIRQGGTYCKHPLIEDLAVLIVAVHNVIADKLDPKELIEKFLIVPEKPSFSKSGQVPLNEKMQLKNEYVIRKLTYLDKQERLIKPFNCWVAKNLNQQLKKKILNKHLEEEIPLKNKNEN
jgi:hypothetical protein